MVKARADAKIAMAHRRHEAVAPHPARSRVHAARPIHVARRVVHHETAAPHIQVATRNPWHLIGISDGIAFLRGPGGDRTVFVGDEVPGLGEVLSIEPLRRKVRFANGMISG